MSPNMKNFLKETLLWNNIHYECVSGNQVHCIASFSYLSSGYDYHRGVDIPAPLYSNVYAIADGTVRIAGSHHAYSSGIVQV